jgi:hypothetical protein
VESLMMGNGGWVRYDSPERSSVYLRFAELDGRLRPVELYWPSGEDQPLGSRAMRDLPLGRLEAWVNDPETARYVRTHIDIPGPPMRTVISYYNVRFGESSLTEPRYRNWAVEMYFDQLGHPDVAHVEQYAPESARGQLSFTRPEPATAQAAALDATVQVGNPSGSEVFGKATGRFGFGSGPELTPREVDPKLKVPIVRPYPDAFYQRVADVYGALAAQHRAVAPIIAEANNVPVSTVHRWVKEARRRGFIGQGVRGRTG